MWRQGSRHPFTRTLFADGINSSVGGFWWTLCVFNCQFRFFFQGPLTCLCGIQDFKIDKYNSFGGFQFDDRLPSACGQGLDELKPTDDQLEAALELGSKQNSAFFRSFYPGPDS